MLLNEEKNVDKSFEMEICGSFRRGAETSGDIDLLITHPDYTSDKETHHKKGVKTDVSILLNEIIDRLKIIKFVTDTIAIGDFKFMVKNKRIFSFPNVHFVFKGVCRLDESKPFRRMDIR